MDRHGRNEQEAWRFLQTEAMNRRSKVHEVATARRRRRARARLTPPDAAARRDGGVTEPELEAAPDRSFEYQPALDGVRALAVLAVMAYHDAYVWAKGGFLGVDAFFVLSGFLITTLLVLEWQRAQSIDAGRVLGPPDPAPAPGAAPRDRVRRDLRR